MAELDYDALQRLVDVATPGPWANYSPNPKTTREQAIYSEWLETDPEARSSEIAALLTPKDAAFIAASRSAVPALLDRVRELEAERDAALSTIAKVRELHRRLNVVDDETDERLGETCEVCGEIEGYEATWPCPTIRALGSVPSTGEGNDGDD